MTSLITEQELYSSIPSYYEGKSIFVTGATGFMGKILLEKLLSSCPGIQRIYILARSKRGSGPHDRLRSMLESPLYTRLRENSPNALKKVVAIRGDVTEPNLGMSPEDEDMITKNVSVILHVAATVKFDDEMSNAIKMNVKGIYSILDLARKVKELSSFVHVSTAYCHCYKEWNSSGKMEERFYPMPTSKYNKYSPDELIAIYEDAKSEGHDKTSDILGIFPNTYIFTKAWAEKVIQENATDLPIVIMRPSIVSASWKEPIPGWVDNLNGPTGMLAAAGVGLMQTIYAKKNKRADLIPVDVACNMVVVLGWKAGTKLNVNELQKPRNIEIYNCTSGSSVPVTWGQVENAMKYLLKYPLENMLWYPYACTGGIMSPMKNYKFQDRVCRVLFHWIPAYVIDTVCYIGRVKTPSRIMLVGRMTKAMKVLEYFSTREWHWDTKNVEVLYDEVSDTDKKMYSFTFRGFPGWDRYLETTMKGSREFAMKSDPATIDESRKTLKKFYITHQLWKMMLIGMFYIFLLRLWTMFKY